MLRNPLIMLGTGWAAVALTGACGPREAPLTTSVSSVWESPEPPPSGDAEGPTAPVSATLPADDVGLARAEGAEPIAIVNGSPVERGPFVDMLLESHGLQTLEQLILLTALRQRAAEMGLTVTKTDISAAHEETLRQLSAPVTDPDEPALDRKQAKQLLAEFLAAKNVSLREWECRMEQRAYLRKIVEVEVNQASVTKDMLENEYALAYGERVQIRVIQVSSLAAARRVRDLLAASKAFELIARQESEDELTAANGGLIRPFTKDDPGVLPLLREASFSLEVGEVSPTLRDDAGGHYIIRLERRFPASNVGFENVDHEKLRRRLLDRLIGQRQRDLERQLFESATVDVRNKELERQFRDKHRRPRR